MNSERSAISILSISEVRMLVRPTRKAADRVVNHRTPVAKVKKVTEDVLHRTAKIIVVVASNGRVFRCKVVMHVDGERAGR